MVNDTWGYRYCPTDRDQTGQISGKGEGINEVENPREEEKKARQRDLREGKDWWNAARETSESDS